MLVPPSPYALVGGSKKTRGDLVEFRSSYAAPKMPFIDPLVSPSTVGGKGEPMSENEPENNMHQKSRFSIKIA